MGQSVLVHTISDIKKVAAYKVKPFKLQVDKESIKDSVSKKVMLEDRLQDVENLLDPKDLEGDTVGGKYLKMANTVSFSDMYMYVIELPVSEHGKPEVNVAKRNEIQISKTMTHSRKSEMMVKIG